MPKIQSNKKRKRRREEDGAERDRRTANFWYCSKNDKKLIEESHGEWGTWAKRYCLNVQIIQVDKSDWAWYSSVSFSPSLPVLSLSSPSLCAPPTSTSPSPSPFGSPSPHDQLGTKAIPTIYKSPKESREISLFVRHPPPLFSSRYSLLFSSLYFLLLSSLLFSYAVQYLNNIICRRDGWSAAQDRHRVSVSYYISIHITSTLYLVLPFPFILLFILLFIFLFFFYPRLVHVQPLVAVKLRFLKQ